MTSSHGCLNLSPEGAKSMASFSEGNDLMNNQNVGTTISAGHAALVPKVEYFRLSPSTSRYYRLMSLAADLDCSWQDIIKEAMDVYLKKYPQKV